MLFPQALGVDNRKAWQLDRLKELPDACYQPESLVALEAETGNAQAAVKQLEVQTLIVDAMLKRTPFCQDAQVE